MTRFDSTNFEWSVIQPLLPKKPRGVPRVDDRRVLNGIFWRLRAGAPWADIPSRYGPHTTCVNRFNRWHKAGVWDRLLDAVSKAYDSGRLGPARQLARIIREHDLSTYVDDICYSACAEVFLSGRERILGQNGGLGFHRSKPWKSGTVNQQISVKSMQYYLQFGLSEYFINRVRGTAYEDMWTPSLGELIVAGVVTHTHDGVTLRDHGGSSR